MNLQPGFFNKLLKSNFFIKLTHWEYWPFGFIQAPLFFYFPWLALKARSVFFFSASNPGILTGGMFGESKYDVMTLVPSQYKPGSYLQKLPATTMQVMSFIESNGLKFPLIFKPDLGERGWMVKRIDNEHDVAAYLQEIRIDFLIQDFVDLPLEFGVFYIRYPSEPHGKVISVVEKEMLWIAGDGRRNMQELILANPRARLQWPSLQLRFQNRLREVLPDAEHFVLVSIGNHCLGTKFINANSLITEKLSASFDQISQEIKGFYFGRFDLRTASYTDLENGNVKVLELNGCGAEPAHIYDPDFSLWTALGVLIRHWKNIYRISVENHALGIPYLSFSEGKAIYRKFKNIRS